MDKYSEYVGKTFGDYVMNNYVGSDGSGHKLYKFTCKKCGESIIVPPYEIISGRKSNKHTCSTSTTPTNTHKVKVSVMAKDEKKPVKDATAVVWCPPAWTDEDTVKIGNASYTTIYGAVDNEGNMTYTTTSYENGKKVKDETRTIKLNDIDIFKTLNVDKSSFDDVDSPDVASDNAILNELYNKYFPAIDEYAMDSDDYHILSENYLAQDDVIRLTVVERDMSTLPYYYNIAHCINTSLNFTGGALSRLIDARYNMSHRLHNMVADAPDDVAEGDVFAIGGVYNVVLGYFENGEYQYPNKLDLYEAVYNLAMTCAEDGTRHLAMPVLGAGHNKIPEKEAMVTIASAFEEAYNDAKDIGMDVQPITIKICKK